MSVQEALEAIETLEARAEYARVWHDAATTQDERDRAHRTILEYVEEIERLQAEHKL